MKKIFLLLLLIQTNIFSQFEYGIKAGLNFNNNLNIKANIESLNEAVNIFESRNGFHIGGFLKLNIGKIYIRPELTYSKINNSYDLPVTLSQQEDIISDFKQSKIDIPVLIGYKFFNMINLFAGPRFEYIGKVNFNDLNIDDLEDKFKTGLHYGLGFKLGKIELDLRVERGFNKNEINFMKNDAELNNQFISTKGKMYLLGFSYYF